MHLLPSTAAARPQNAHRPSTNRGWLRRALVAAVCAATAWPAAALAGGAAPVAAAGRPAAAKPMAPAPHGRPQQLSDMQHPLRATTQRACTPDHRPGQASCDAQIAWVIGSGRGYTPLDLQVAYSLPSADQGYGVVVGIVDAYDDPTAESDMAAYRANFGLPPCSSASGCFSKVNQMGGSSYPPPDAGWAVETSLDLDMISATCPNCHIVLVEAASSLISDLGTAVDEAVAKGATVISNSYGSSEWSGETGFDPHYAHSGVAIFASSGDNGYGVEYPAASPYVTAVGGTTLTTDKSSLRGFTETAWSGSGSGCSAYEAKPQWQADPGCGNRTVADVSADGDPNTPVQTYDSYGEPGWIELGGTSASSPIVAGIDALSGDQAVFNAGANAFYSSAYGFPASINDVTSGSNGSCGGSYLCTAGPRYDGPTGLGTPNGPPPSPSASAQGGPFGSGSYGGGNGGSSAAKPCAKGDPVECASGNYYENTTDLAVPGRGRALSLTRTYNAQAAAAATSAGPVGYGWTHSYNESLSVDASGNVTVTQEDGATVVFSPSGSGYSAPTWVNATLVKNADGSYTYTRADQRSDGFNAAGQLVSETEQHGYTTSLAYDGSGRLSTVTDPAGRALSFAYNAAGQVAAVTDPAGRVVSYGYDGSGNLTSATDAAGAVTRYAYDASHRLTAMTRPDGGVTQNVYDASNRVTSQIDPLGKVTTWAYASGQTTITNPNGDVSVQSFSNGMLTAATKAGGTPQAATWTYTYARGYERATETDPDGNTTRYIYDLRGNLLTVTDPLGRVSTMTYDAKNNLASKTDPDGITTSYTLDQDGDTTQIAVSSGGTPLLTSYAHGDSAHPGDVTAMTDADGNTWHYAYDAAGDRNRITDPAGGVTASTYDAAGRQLTQVSPGGGTTTYQYDGDGRQTRATDPLGHSLSKVFDGDGNMVQRTDQSGDVTHYSYDLADQQTGATRADGTSVAYTYDADGNRLTATNGAGQTTHYSYDQLDRVVSTTDALTRTSSFHYSPGGNRTAVVDASGHTTSYAYDADGELTAVGYTSGEAGATYSYEPDGKRTAMTDGSGTTSYVYDGLNRLVSLSNNAGTVGYAYDALGHVVQLTYPNGLAVTRGYDSVGHMASVTDWNGATTSFAYDADSNLSSETYGNGVVASYGYNSADQLTSMSDRLSGHLLMGFSYTRDNSGLLASDTGSGGATDNQSYGYTALQQLGTVTTAGALPAGYTFDHADNLTGLPSGATMSYDAANEVTALHPPAAGTVTSFGYDAQGERTSATTGGNTTSYGFDQSGRLTSVGGVATYGYDGNGLRATKSLLTPIVTTYFYAWDPVTAGDPELLSDGLNSFVYGPDGLPFEQISAAGTPTYLHHDQIGSTRLLTSSSGVVVGNAGYDPYGNTVTDSGSVTTPFGFAGQYKDSESGLVYLRARYYDPATGQFLSRDPLSDRSLEPYSYADGNPTNLTDPSGLWCLGPQWICDAAGSVVHWVGHAASSVGGFIWDHRGLIATGGAIVGCFIPGVDFVACTALGAIALGTRVEQRWQDNGWSGSWKENLVDIFTSVASFGLVAIPGALGLGEAPEGLMSAFGITKADAVELSGLWQQILVKGSLSGPDIVGFLGDLLVAAHCP